MIISCSIANDHCFVYPGYSVVIDPATQKHTLTIDSFNTTFDVGNWTCRDTTLGGGQTTCRKEVASLANTTINCMGAAIPEQKTTLSCEITGTVAGGILWWRPNNRTPQMIFSCNDECHLYPGYSVVIDPATQKHTYH